MSNHLNDLFEQRKRAIGEAREMSDKLHEEKRDDFTEEEQAKYDTIMKDVSDLKRKIDREVELRNLESSMKEEREGTKRIPDEGKRRTADQKFRTADEARASEEYIALFRNWISCDRDHVGEARREIAAFEKRALEAGTLTKGGALIPPEQFVAELIKFVDDAVWIRQWGRTFQLRTAKSMGAPSLDTDVDDAEWTTELGTGTEDSSMAFGKRELNPSPFAKRIKESETLLNLSAIPIEQLIRERLGYKIAVTEEKAFLTGSGASQPLGIFTASSQGISTARDVATDNDTDNVTFDGLKSAKGALKQQYRRVARWIMHRDLVTKISKLKDGNGRYLWQDSVQVGDPDMILDIPVGESEFAPNTFTTGQYVAVLGDYSKYWIADAMDMTIKRLDELYAETNQVGFISRMETDGMPVLEEAFVRVKLG